MSNSIWHKPSETTDVDNNLIIHDWVNRTYELGYFDDNDMIFRNFRNDDTYFEESMMCWCDIDDLIAQVDKAERLQKAVNLIANMEQRLCIDDPVDILDDILQIAKDEIKQIKEQQ